MAEEKDKEKEKENEKTTPKSGLNIKLIAIVAVLVVVLAMGMAYGVAKLVMSSIAPSTTTGQGQVGDKSSTEVGALFDVGEYVANISSESGPRIVKVKITFDLTDETMNEEITSKLPKVQDTILTILRSKTAEEVQDPKTTQQLKDEIKDKTNEFITKGRISNVYFTYFILQ